jgi:hypothetical protein
MLFNVLFFSTNFNAQSNLLDNAELFVNAIVERNYEQLLDLTHPDILIKGGGRDLLMSDYHKERQMMVDKGMEYIEAVVFQPNEFLEFNGEIQTLLTVKYKLLINKLEYESTSNLLAVSKNNGGHWVFVDLNKYNKESLKDFIDNLSPDLVFPDSNK